MKTIKVKTDYTGCRTITAGKVYESSDVREYIRCNSIFATIVDDSGAARNIIVRHDSERCGWLDGEGIWEILPEGPSMEDELAECLAVMLEKFEARMGDFENPEFTPAYVSAKAVLTKYKESKQ
jgi:hypothetical protein